MGVTHDLTLCSVQQTYGPYSSGTKCHFKKYPRPPEEKNKETKYWVKFESNQKLVYESTLEPPLKFLSSLLSNCSRIGV